MADLPMSKNPPNSLTGGLERSVGGACGPENGEIRNMAFIWLLYGFYMVFIWLLYGLIWFNMV